MSRVIIVCEKSINIQELRKANKAVVLSCSEIMSLFDSYLDNNFNTAYDIIKKYLYSKALAILEIGTNVILDCDFRTKCDIESTAKFFREYGYICELHNIENNLTEKADVPKVHRLSSPDEKIALYRSLFRGREDIYALRWTNAKTGKSGYSPVCVNKWVSGVCDMTNTNLRLKY